MQHQNDFDASKVFFDEKAFKATFDRNNFKKVMFIQSLFCVFTYIRFSIKLFKGVLHFHKSGMRLFLVQARVSSWQLVAERMGQLRPRYES